MHLIDDQHPHTSANFVGRDCVGRLQLAGAQEELHATLLYTCGAGSILMGDNIHQTLRIAFWYLNAI